MDSGFEAIRRETTVGVPHELTHAEPTPARDIARALASAALACGDFTGLTTWFVLSMRSEREEVRGSSDAPREP